MTGTKRSGRPRGRFELLRPLGAGASATVFAVRDRRDDALRALKLLREGADEAILRAEFAELARLRSPQLVAVHDLARLEEPLARGDIVVAAAGRLGLVCELCEGRSLASVLGEQEAGAREPWVRRVAEDLASALAELHGAGIVHHDVKPANVLWVDGRGAVLLDLGLATPTHAAPDGARGTPRYLSPEALAGSADPAVDLYALGATLFELCEGRELFAGREGAELIRAILEEVPALEATWLSPELRELVASLLAKTPGGRPGSARGVLVTLARMRGDDGAAARIATRHTVTDPTELCGREEELSRVARVLAGDTRVLVVAGAPGTGKSALIEESLRRQRLRAAARLEPQLELARGTLRAILARAGMEAPDPARPLDDLALEALARIEAMALGRRGVAVLEVEVPQDPLALRLLEVAAASDGVFLLVAEVAGAVPPSLRAQPRACVVELGALPAAAVGALVRSMLGGDPPADLAARVAALSEGNPALAVELVRTWHLEGAAGLDLGRIAGLDALLARSAGVLAPEELAIVAALAAWGAPARVATLARLVGGRGVEPTARRAASLARRHLIRIDDGELRFPTRAHAEAWARLTRDRAGIERVHRRALAELAAISVAERSVEVEARLARHRLAAGDRDGPRAALEAGRRLVALHAPLAAIPLLEEALRRSGEETAPDIRATLAEVHIQAGRYTRALELLGENPRSREGQLLRAQALQRSGEYAEAERLLREVVPTLEGDERARATALLGRLLLAQGRAVEARQATAPELARLDAGAELLAGGLAILEVAGLAALYQGEHAEADRVFARGEQGLADGPASQLARFVSLRGMVATTGGRHADAAALYRRALALVEAGGDAHGRATYRVNLASALIELGAFGEALERLSAAVTELERLARTAELASGLCNLANLYLLLGDGAAAGRQLARARALGERVGRPVAAYLEMLEGDRARVERDPARALEHYLAARAIFDATGAKRERALCELARCDALVEAGRLLEARAALTATPLESEPDPELRGAAALSWARFHLAGGGALPEACLPVLAAHCAQLERHERRKDLFRAAALLGRCLRAAGQTAAARAALSRARRTWEGIVHDTPESHRTLIERDPDARALAAEWAALEGAPEAPAARAAPEEADRIRRLLAINKRLNSELRLPRLLEAIMDTVIELTEAERGFLLLTRKDGTLAVKVARNIDRRSLEGDELALSRSIAERAARAGSPIVTVDALADGRFQQALSVSDLQLRSVLAVPLSVKGRVVGTVYIDNRLRGGVFGEAEVRLVQDVADQAAIAIENARLLAANRRKRKLIQRLNRALARKLETKQAELLEVREELRSSKEALQMQGYGAIVGRSPRMRELFQLLERVTETELPVVVLGESGTGKELVARAIHLNGPRASRPFVSENCAAIPETLLESILFGHVRGAFTGADRDRRGLFEVASGGTLFLDEVGEMSAAMQTKLLRVLQDGELRRVGGSQTIRTDVRVIAASNKDLGELVAAGRFREDLFYRLNVIQVKIPPLRERREDIPLLCDHFLEKHAAGQGRKLSAEALARLSGYAWPGNVRELENEIMRAAALAGRVIQARDLSPAIAGSAPLAIARGSGLELRPRVEHLERELITQSLRLAAGNHTQAARSLGLSRFGLLKKLRRYGLSG